MKSLLLPNPFAAVLLVAALFSGPFSFAQSAQTAPVAQTTEERFEKTIRSFEATDKALPPPKGAILLIGDSQFFRWKTLAEDLPGYTIINRGVDSFQFSDVLRYFDRLVSPYEPRFIVLHVGGNDVNNGKTPEQILSDFKRFVEKVRTKSPNVPIAFTSTTPGPGRWSQAETRKKTNAALKEYISTQKNLLFIDLWDAMLTNGQPREDLWVEDRVHPNQAGYQIRVRMMRPLLGSP